MSMIALLLLPLADEITERHLTWQNTVPFMRNVPLWMFFPVFLLAIGLIVYLYHAQQRIVSRRLVLGLTGIRLGLVLLLLLMLAQPAMSWIRSTTTAGTLWLMLDQSPSMAMTDPQATELEHLRWAAALGYLPATPARSELDLSWARLVCLRDTFPGLKPAPGGTEPPGPPDPARVQAFLAPIREFADDLSAATDVVEKDALVRADGRNIPAALRNMVQRLRNDVTTAASERLPELAARRIHWDDHAREMDSAQRNLKALVDRADQEFLKANGANAAVRQALERVGGMSRADLAYRLLTGTGRRGTESLAESLPRFRTKVVGVADEAQANPAVDRDELDGAVRRALTPTGSSTNLAAGLQLINEQVGADESAAVMILSDGRHNLPGDVTEPARLLAARNIKVYGLLIGSQEVSPDAAAEQVTAPSWIYKGDTIRANALVRLDGLAGRKLDVQLLRNGQVVDTQSVVAASGQDARQVQFTDTPPEARAFEYEVRVAEVPGDVNLQNNRQSFHVAVKKDKLAALLIEDQARWEYQYLANLLARDTRLKLQTVLLSPAQVANVEAPARKPASPANAEQEATLPETRDQWNAFDLIILGDVPPERLSASAQQFLAAAVRDRGTTLVVIAGANHMPVRYLNAPLADLLPVRLTREWTVTSLDQHRRGGFRPAPAPGGAGSILSQFAVQAEANAQLWGRIPNWYWHSECTQARPAAEVIWAITDPDPQTNAEAPAGRPNELRQHSLLSYMSLGLGRVLYLASDQTWRLRQVNGENLHERFWGQVIGWAVGSDLPAGGRFVRFGTNPLRYTAGQPVTVTARVLREDLTPCTSQQIQVVATLQPEKDRNGLPRGAPREAGLARMVELPEAPGYYRATLGNLQAGMIELSLRGGEVERLLNEDPTVTQKSLLIQILPHLDLEQRNVNTDRSTLARLAQKGGGIALDGPYGDVLTAHLLRYQHPRINRSTERLGLFADDIRSRTAIATHTVTMILFAGLLTAEWLLRKRGGLL